MPASSAPHDPPQPPSSAIDTSVASIGRVYDAFLDGEDNYEVDREVRDAVLAVAPDSKRVAQELRRWLGRVSRYLAKHGVDQFLDCGCGLPSADHIHQVVRWINPETRVVYVDNDPVVAAHGRALLQEEGRAHFVEADLTRPRQVLEHPDVAASIDWDRPLMLMQCATMHHVSPEQDPEAIMREYIDALPRGSYVGLTHFWDPEDGGEGTALAREVEETYRNSSMSPVWYRTRAEIERMLPGLELLEPGLVELAQWWPDGPAQQDPSLIERLMLGGVARKP